MKKMSRKRISEIVLNFIVALFIYWAFFFIYKNSISPTHLYHGYYFNELTYVGHAIALGFFLLPLFWLPVTPKRPSDITIWLLYMFSYAPTTFMCFHVMKNPFPDAIFLLIILLLGLILIDLFRRHRINLNFHLDTPIVIPLDTIIIMLLIFICIYIVYLTNFNFNLDFANVYERRLETRESHSFMSGYVLAFGRSVIFIFSVYLIFVKKSKTSIFLLFILSIGIFSYDGTKNSLLIPVLLVLVYFLNFYKKSHAMLNIVLLLMILVSIIEFIEFNSHVISTFFTRRIFAVPGYLNVAFWEYFSDHDKIMMADSIGRYFFDSPSVISPTFLIGYEYFGNFETNANTGIWMGGYAHFGLIGLILISTIAGFIIGLIDHLTKTKFTILGYLACAYIGIVWSEQMLHTSILTGGILYILILLMIYCNPKIFNRKINFLNKWKCAQNNTLKGGVYKT